MTDGCAHLPYNSSWKFHKLAAGAATVNATANGYRTVRKKQAVRPVHHIQNHTCRVTVAACNVRDAHCNKNPISVFLFWELRAWPQSQFPHSYVCERFIYFQDRSTYSIFLQQNRQIDCGIYKSLTDTWMVKLIGLWPCNSFSGNICFEFSALVLWSAWRIQSGNTVCLLIIFSIYMSVVNLYRDNLRERERCKVRN